MSISRDRLVQLLHYDEVTGIFTWVHASSNRIKVGDVAGTVGSAGYIYIKVDGVRHGAHQLAFIFMGEEVPGVIDHVDTIPSNNAWCNLRPATPQSNSYNIGITSRNTSGIKGVGWDKGRKRWVAKVSLNGKQHTLGRFTSKLDAEAAAKLFREKNHKEFARSYNGK